MNSRIFDDIPLVQECPRCVAAGREQPARYAARRLAIMVREGALRSDRTFLCTECELPILVTQTLRLEKPKSDLDDSLSDEVIAQVLMAKASSQQKSTITLKPSQLAVVQSASPKHVGPIDIEEQIREIEFKVCNWIKVEYLLAGRFKLLQELGRGATAVVARATDLETNRSVAVKFTFKTALPGVAGRIAREKVMRAHNLQAMFRTVHVPKPIVLVAEDGLLISVEEYVHGTTLAGALEKGETVQQQFAIMIGVQLCNVLEAGWEQGRIIHRDIKPANVLISAQGSISSGLVCKLIDWGLCTSLGNDKRDTRPVHKEDLDRLSNQAQGQLLTLAGVIQGTLEYMPIEQANNEWVDYRADIYSLGGTLYHAVTGRPPMVPEPFAPLDELEELKTIPEDDLSEEQRRRKGELMAFWLAEKQASDMLSLISQIRDEHHHPEPAHLVAAKNNKWVSQNLSQVLNKALSKDPRDRFQDHASFRKALMECMRDEPPAEPSPQDLLPEPTEVQERTQSGRWKRWLPWWMGGE